jgi:hypothetical protein
MIDEKRRRRPAPPAREVGRPRLPTPLGATRTIAAVAGLRFRTGFVDGELASAEAGIRQRSYGGLRLIIGGHLDERKPARPTGGHVAYDVHGFDGAGTGKQGLQVLLARIERQIANIQFL